MEEYRNSTTTADRPPTYTTVSTTRSTGSGTIWFIVGGLLVAVAILAFVMSGTDMDATAPAPAGDVTAPATAPAAAPETTVAPTTPPATDTATVPEAPATGTESPATGGATTGDTTGTTTAPAGN